jgi:hypothetical protein
MPAGEPSVVGGVFRMVILVSVVVVVVALKSVILQLHTSAFVRFAGGTVMNVLRFTWDAFSKVEFTYTPFFKSVMFCPRVSPLKLQEQLIVLFLKAAAGLQAGPVRLKAMMLVSKSKNKVGSSSFFMCASA